MDNDFFRLDPMEESKTRLKGLLGLIVAISYIAGITNLLAIPAAINNNPSKIPWIAYNAVMNLVIAIMIHKRIKAVRIVVIAVQVISVASALINIVTYYLFRTILTFEDGLIYKQVMFLLKAAFIITYFTKSVYVRKYFGLDVKPVEEVTEGEKTEEVVAVDEKDEKEE